MPATDSIELSTWLPAPVERVYEAWVDGEQHAQMTEAPATSDPRVGGKFTAFDDYITGMHLSLQPSLIVQSWRTSEFPADAPDSRLEVELRPEKDGTRLTLRHTGIPQGDGPRYAQGWRDFYFAPLEWFVA